MLGLEKVLFAFLKQKKKGGKKNTIKSLVFARYLIVQVQQEAASSQNDGLLTKVLAIVSMATTSTAGE